MKVEIKQLTVASSPHIHSGDSVRSAMRHVIGALAPAVAFAAYHFGLYSLLVVITGMITAVLAEALILYILKKPITTVRDGSAAVTGLLLAMNLPAGIPLWIVIIGAGVAIGIGKHVFGGLGHNPFNPALVGRAILVASWPGHMTAWVGAGLVSMATPLAIMKGGGTVSSSTSALLFGLKAGSLGEVSVFLLLLGGLYLVYKQIIDWKIPAYFIGTVALMTFIFGGQGLFNGDPLFHVLSGGLMLGAFFMASDWTTSPVTKRGRIIMGIGCGLITSVIRLKGGMPEGVSYAILLMNAVTPLIDRYTMGKRFGS
ncbi:MAG: RnfABCDGE type electron transport complex subunit D [bacterium]|nr:RnfABCDGE type electron transport complex subunit D [bacterium]